MEIYGIHVASINEKNALTNIGLPFLLPGQISSVVLRKLDEQKFTKVKITRRANIRLG